MTTHSEVGADITIRITGIIIRIHIERACIRAIISVTADMYDADQHESQPLTTLTGEAGADNTTRTTGNNTRIHNERARKRASIRVTADKHDAIR